jgi:hypothetical protein
MTYENDGFDQADAHIIAVNKVLTDPETIQDVLCDAIGNGIGTDLMAIILGASSDAAKLKAINDFKAQYLDAQYTKLVIEAESNKLFYQGQP